MSDKPISTPDGIDQELAFFEMSMQAFKALPSDAKDRVLHYYQKIYEQEREGLDVKVPD